ncbi:MAG: hypothetical protein KF729_01220 [Sandaracinaceae bacterium]|nr:hypothetical protein [Sandaracinaceae bacterium]
MNAPTRGPRDAEERAGALGTVVWVGEGAPSAALAARDVRVLEAGPGAPLAPLLALAPDLLVLAAGCAERWEELVALLREAPTLGAVPVAAIDAGASASRAAGRFGLVARFGGRLEGEALAAEVATLLERRALGVEREVTTGGVALAEAYVGGLVARGVGGFVVAGSGAAALVTGDGRVVPAVEALFAGRDEAELAFVELPAARVPSARDGEGGSLASARVELVGVAGGALASRLAALGAEVHEVEGTPDAWATARKRVPSVVVLGAHALSRGEVGAPWDDERALGASFVVVADEPEERVLAAVRAAYAAERAVLEVVRTGEALRGRLETFGAARWLKLVGAVAHPLALEVVAPGGRARVELDAGKVKRARFFPRGGAPVEGKAALTALLGLKAGRLSLGTDAQIAALPDEVPATEPVRRKKLRRRRKSVRPPGVATSPGWPAPRLDEPEDEPDEPRVSAALIEALTEAPRERPDEEGREEGGREEGGREEGGREEGGREEGGRDEEGRDEEGRDEEGRDEEGRDEEGRDEEGREEEGREEEGREEEGREEEGREEEGREEATAGDAQTEADGPVAPGSRPSERPSGRPSRPERSKRSRKERRREEAERRRLAKHEASAPPAASAPVEPRSARDGASQPADEPVPGLAAGPSRSQIGIAAGLAIAVGLGLIAWLAWGRPGPAVDDARAPDAGAARADAARVELEPAAVEDEGEAPDPGEPDLAPLEEPADDAEDALDDAVEPDDDARLEAPEAVASDDVEELVDPEEEAALARLALQRAPEDARAHLRLAAALHRLGQHAEAIERASRSVALDPRHGPSHLLLGDLQRARRRPALARRAYQTCVEQVPDFAPCRERLDAPPP